MNDYLSVALPKGRLGEKVYRLLATAGFDCPGVLEDGDTRGGRCTGAAVEVDGRVATSRGPGTAMDFALCLVELLAGRETRNKVEEGLVR